jgi:hypothetical protein
VDALVLLDSDWSPVFAVELVDDDWLPVLVVVSVLIDWLPVEVVFSIVTLERPRRSMEGLKVELEPVMDEFTSDVDPVMALLALLEDPVTELVLAALAAFAVDGLLLEALGAVDDGTLALALLALLVALLALVPACESGMQSMWTGLDELSLALPVDLSASLPAFGWFRLLHSGLLADAALAVVAGWLAELDLLEASALFFARARFAEPSRVARASALR